MHVHAEENRSDAAHVTSLRVPKTHVWRTGKPSHLSITPLPSRSIWSNILSALALRLSNTSCLLAGSGVPLADRLAMLFWVCAHSSTKEAW